MLWAAAGYHVSLYDLTREIVDSSLRELVNQIGDMDGKGLLRGPTSADRQIQLISGLSIFLFI